MDATLAKKLHLKSGQRPHALHAPEGLEPDPSCRVRPVRQVALDDAWSALHCRPPAT